MANNINNINNLKDIEKFLKQNSISIEEAYQSSLGIMDKGQLKATEASYDAAFARELDTTRKELTKHGLEMALDYDKGKNEIKILTYPKGAALQDIFTIKGGKGSNQIRHKEYNKDKVAVTMVPIPDVQTGGATMGGGRYYNRPTAVLGKSGSPDELYRSSMAQIKYINKTLSNKDTTKTFSEIQKSFNWAKKATNSVYNQLSTEAVKEQQKASKVAGTGNLYGQENQIKAAGAQLGEYLKELSLVYNVEGFANRALESIANRILLSTNRSLEIASILKSKEYEQLVKSTNKTRGKELLERLKSFGDRYNLEETSFKSINESALDRGVPGGFTKKILNNAIGTAIQRDQTLLQTPRKNVKVKGEKWDVFTQSAIKSTKELEAAGIVRGSGVKRGVTPYDAQSLMVYVVPNSETVKSGKNYEDQIIASDSAIKSISSRRNVKFEIGTDEIRRAIKKLQEGGYMFDPQTGEILDAGTTFNNMRQTVDLKGLQKENKELYRAVLYNYVLKERVKALGRDAKSFGFPSEQVTGGLLSKDKFQLSDRIRDQDTGKIVVNLVEQMPGMTGVKLTGFGGLAKASVVRNQKEIDELRKSDERYYGKAHFAVMGGDLNNVRKGATFIDQMMKTLIQEYGNRYGLNYREGGGVEDLIANLAGITGGTNELKYDKILAEALSGVFVKQADGSFATDFTRFMPNVAEAMKQNKVSESKLADVMMHLMPLVDRLINGVDQQTGELQDINKFYSENQNRYIDVRRGKNGNILGYDYTGKNIRMFGSIHQSDEYPWGEVDLRRPAEALNFDLEELRRRGKINESEYSKYRNEIEKFKNDYILADQKSREELAKQQTEFNDAYKKTLESAQTGFSFDQYQDKKVIRIGRAGDSSEITGRSNVITVDIDSLKRGTYGEPVDPNELGEQVRKAITEAISQGYKESDIEVLLDPGFGEGEGAALGDKDTAGKGKYLFLDKKTFLSADSDYSLGKGGLFDTSEGYKALINSIFSYQDKKNKVEFGKTFGNILHQAANDLFNEGGAKYAYYSDAKAKGSTGLKILGMNADWLLDYYGKDNLTYEQRLKGELAKSGALISKEFGQKTLEQLTDDELRDIVKLFDKNFSGESRKSFIDTIVKYYTIDSQEFKSAMSKVASEEDYQKMFGEGLKLIFARSPYSHLKDLSYTRAFIDDELKGTRAIRVGAAPLFKHGADFDGDVASVMGIPKEYSELFKTLQSGQTDVDDLIGYMKYREITEKMDDASKTRIGAKKGSTNVTKAEMAKIISQNFGDRAALEQRIQKTGTGILANWRGQFAGLLKKKVSEGGAVSPEEQIALAFFEGIAQDAISSKKVVNNLIRLGLGDFKGKQWKDKDIDKLTDKELEAYGAGWGNLNKLINDAYTYSGPGATPQKKAENVRKHLEDIGLISGGYFQTEKKEIIAHPLMTLSQTKEGREWLKNNGIFTGEIAETGFTREDIDKLLKSKNIFRIPVEALFGGENGKSGVLNSIKIGNKTYNFAELLTELTTKKYAPEKVDYTPDRIDFQGKSDIIQKVSKDILEYQNRINATADAVNAEAKAEQNKIGIAQKEGKAFKDNVGVLSKYEQALENITEQSGEFETVTNRVYKSLQGVSGFIGKGENIPLLDLQKQNYVQIFGQALYDEQADEKQNKEFAAIRTGAFNKWIKKFDEVDLATMYGYKDVNKFISERGDIGLSSAIGTFSHAVEQIVLEANKLAKTNYKNIDEVLAATKGNSKAAKALRGAGISDWYNRELETLRNQAVLLYGGGAAINTQTGAQFIDEDLQQRFLMAKFAGSAMAQSFYSKGKATGTPLYSEIIGSEIPLITKDEYGTNLYGRADQVSISADGKALIISDNKYTKGGLKGTEIGQQIFYNLQSNELRDELKEFTGAGGEVKDWLERKNYGRSPRNQVSLDFAKALQNTAYTTNEIRKFNAGTGNIEIYTIDASSVSKDTKAKLKQGLTLSSEDNRALLASAKLSRIEEIRDEDISKYIADEAQQKEILKIRKQRREAATSKEDVTLITEYINLLKSQKEIELEIFKIQKEAEAARAAGKNTDFLQTRLMNLEDEKKGYDEQLKDEKYVKIKSLQEISDKQKELDEENQRRSFEFEAKYDAKTEEAYAKKYKTLFEERQKLSTKRDLYSQGQSVVDLETQAEYAKIINAANARIAEIDSELSKIESSSQTVNGDFATNLKNEAILKDKEQKSVLKEVSEALRSYNTLLKERYKIELELATLREREKYAGVRGFNTSDIKEQIGNDESALAEYDKILKEHPIANSEYADASIESQLKAKNERAGIKMSGDIKLAAEQSAEADYQKLYSNRLSIERQLMSYSHQYDLSFGKQKDTLGEVVSVLREKLQLNDEEIKKLENTNLLREDEKKKIKDNYEFEKKVASIQEGSRYSGAKSIWDVMANDIRRATMRIADFGIAAKVLNKIPQDIQKVIQYTKELDAAMTNVRIVSGYTEEQAKSLMKSYTELGKKLGATTVEVANSANEWLKVWATINSFNCWNTLRAL